MPVYVDDMKAKYGRLVMCHMLADTEEELVTMAKLIGVSVKWHQYPGTYKSHFDICMTKRKLAISAGAISIDRKKVAEILKRKRLYDT